jgi:glycosyltransferase involved in cell wall biosynthesis
MDSNQARAQEHPMTACMLIWDYWPGREGGAQRQCRKLSQALAQRGVRVLVITQRSRWLSKKSFSDQGTRIIRLGMFAPLAAVAIWLRTWKVRRTSTDPGKSPGNKKQRLAGPTTPFWWLARLSFMAAAAWFIFRNRRELDLIHAHESNWIGGFASWLGVRAGLPVVCKVATWPCLEPMGPDVPFRATLRHWQRRPYFIALNGAMAEELKNNGIAAEKIRVIPNGVLIPAQPALCQNDFNVLCIANFNQENHLKAYDVLLKAWKQVHLRNPRARLTMAGGGDSRPWRNLARQLGCAVAIAFVGSIPDLDSYFKSTAVFVLPSRIEGMSNALLETQSWGIPAVVSDIPGNRAVVRDNANGLVVPVDDAAALAEAILRALADPGLRTRLGRQARQRISENYSLPVIAARIMEFYQEMTGAGKANTNNES